MHQTKSSKALSESPFKPVIERIIDHTGGNIVLGIPLGLGKPNQLVNAIYQYVKANKHYTLKIITALSLSKPEANSFLEKKLLDPVLERLFKDYVELDYVQAVKKQCLPSNIEVSEFFFQPASMLNNSYAQQHYISSNYTHVPRDLIAQGINVVAQLVAKKSDARGTRYSLSCNPEISLDLVELFRELPAETHPLNIAQVHRDLPFMRNDAEVNADFFDIVIDNPDFSTQLFATPNTPVSLVDHAIGFHASTLIKDGGTLQIGIGALGDAITHHLIMRHCNNDLYQSLVELQQYSSETQDLIKHYGGTTVFEHGLYGCSEMFVSGFLNLQQQGILKRQVYDNVSLQQLINSGTLKQALDKNSIDILYETGFFSQFIDQHQFQQAVYFGIFKSLCQYRQHKIISPNGVEIDADLSNPDNRQQLAIHCLGSKLKNGYLAHAGFFLGSQEFYHALNALSDTQQQQINMTGISYINDFHWQTELKSAQRQHARYLNTVFNASLLGASAADMLEDGRVLSGVGGQYNFVAQAQEIANGRSILMLRSTRCTAQDCLSNFVWNYAHTTIPRHLRDIYISEYGIADVRGKKDSDVIKALLNISDTRFQQQLLSTAKQAGKIESDYFIPERFRSNTIQHLNQKFKPALNQEKLPQFPFGSSLTQQELQLVKALTWLKNNTYNKAKLSKTLLLSLLKPKQAHTELIERMQLQKTYTFKQAIYKKMLLYALDSI